MNLSISGHQVWLIERVAVAAKIGHFATGFFHHEKTGGAIPGLEFVFIESVKAAGGHPAEVDRGRTKTANGNPFSDEPVKYIQRAIGHIKIGVGETGHQTGFPHIGFLAYPDRFTVKGSAFSFFGYKQFVEYGCIYGTHYHLPVFFQTYGDTTERESMGKVYGTINRVHDPLKGGVLFHGTCFFTQYVVIGVVFSDDFKNGFLRSMVGFCDEVVDPFLIGNAEFTIEKMREGMASGTDGF